MQKQRYLLTLLFFSCSCIQAKDQELPGGHTTENVSFERRAIEDFNVDAFKAALEKSEPDCKGDKVLLMLKLCDTRQALFGGEVLRPFALKAVEYPPGFPTTADFVCPMVCIVGIAQAIIANDIVYKAIGATGALASLFYLLYSIEDDKERDLRVKMFEDKSDKAKNKLDIINAMVELLRAHSEATVVSG